MVDFLEEGVEAKSLEGGYNKVQYNTVKYVGFVLDRGRKSQANTK